MISGKRINLKPIDEDDIELMRKWRNAYSGQFFTEDYIKKEQQRVWYDHYRESSTDKMFIIQLKDGTKIGTIALYNISLADRTADVGRIILVDEHRGYGYMQEAVTLIRDLAFEQMNLWKLRLSTHLDNIDALKTYSACGFKSLTRPVMLLECVNRDVAWKKPILVESYDDLAGEEGYESQGANIGD